MNEKMDFKAFNEGGMDEFMRKTVEGHSVEPRPGLWKGISRRLLLRELAHFNFTNLSTRFWLTGAAGVLALAAALYIMLPDRNPAVPSAITTVSTTGPNNAPVQEVIPASSTPYQRGSKPAGGSMKLFNATNQVPKTVKPTGKITPKSPEPLAYAYNLPDRTISSPARESYATTEHSAVIPAENTGNAAITGLIVISPLVPFESSGLLVNPAADTIITLHTASGISRFLVTKPSAAQFFSVNLEIVPEMSFYTAPEAYSKINVWVNGGLAYHFSRFSLATAVGLGYVYDKGNYKVEYKRNDSVGYFTSVVSYTVGTNNEIIYNTVNKNIYDSLIHHDDYRTLNRYAYLQVPLLLGYRLIENGRVSLTFQAGPAVSFLLGTRKASPVIEYDNARITRVDDNTPARVHTNWQVWGNLLLELRMNRKISIYFEPSCKYYLNPMVEQENASFKAPWSAGLGVGIQFNFAPKKKNP